MRVAVFREDPVTESGPKRFYGVGNIVRIYGGSVPVQMDASGETVMVIWDDIVVLTSGLDGVKINARNLDGVFVADIYLGTQSLGTVTFEHGMFVARTLDLKHRESSTLEPCINFLVVNSCFTEVTA